MAEPTKPHSTSGPLSHGGREGDLGTRDSQAHWPWRILGGVGILLLMAVIVATFFPILGRQYQVHQGERDCEVLEALFQAKKDFARDLRIDPSLPLPAIVQELRMEDLAPYLKKYGGEHECPAGGRHTIRPLIGADGEVIPPICSHEEDDPDGNGLTNGQEGLHIHRRSYLVDPESGVWFRDPSFFFPQKDVSL